MKDDLKRKTMKELYFNYCSKNLCYQLCNNSDEVLTLQDLDNKLEKLSSEELKNIIKNNR